MINIDCRENLGDYILENIKEGIVKGMEEWAGVVNNDIIAQSRVAKTGITRMVMVNGSLKRHTSANASRGESTAELTGDQNRGRYSISYGDSLSIGVKESVSYAGKNEEKFKDIQQGINRNVDNIAPIIANHIEKLFKI